ncbi:MAG: hypothetical protein ACOX6T_11070 [Myxococcales bacterium]|jgi:hypothetical protein
MKPPAVSYSINSQTSAFVVENYNWAKAFSNFFPGIAGKWGIPLWIYYVNQGQALCSLGVRDKDGQLLEFQSFNKAIMRVAREGFRTFLKLDGGAVYEPFLKTADPSIKQTMEITPAELVLRERNEALALEIEVAYFPLPNLPLAALAREVRIRNLGKKLRRLEWIDGAARVLPFGLDQKRIKFIPRHIEAMFGVEEYQGVPLFRLKQTPDDSERVGKISGGNFYLAVGEGNSLVVDPEVVFGERPNLDFPWVFESSGLRRVLAAEQFRENKTPCAFTARRDRLRGGAEIALTTVIGNVRRDEDLDTLLAATKDERFFAEKRCENTRVIGEIAEHAFTASSSPLFDAYSRQTFLDNVVRGGMPITFPTKQGTSAFYVYSRQNGDLERDYHFFVLEPTYLSQGTGHYRSVLQNRRTDTWFFPKVEDANLRTFLNLIQLDGYNPLEVNQLSYRAEDLGALDKVLASQVRAKRQREELLAWMQRGFTPGELLMRLEQIGAGVLPNLREDFLGRVLSCCRENEIGGLHEGFWTDHWHYNLDLLDVYLMVYPERLEDLLLGRRNYTFFDDPDVVLPRSERCVDVGGRVRNYGPVVRDAEKLKRIKARKQDPYTVRTRYGAGGVYRTNLLVKLLCLVTNRLATLDAGGTGMEMEAGKPGWNDSMNGLPGLFGSGLSETIELHKTVRFLVNALDKIGKKKAPVPVYEELADFMAALRKVIKARLGDRTKAAAFKYWDESNSIKEAYRARTKLGVSGKEAKVALAEIQAFLQDGKALLDRIFTSGRDHVLSPEGVPYTYFVNDVTKSEPLGRASHLGYPLVRPLAFKQRPVKLFLEGPVHWMKARPGEAKSIYDAVRASDLFDAKLGMYKSCENLEGETYELGRAVGAYPRGWIENESIYLHMEYKYLLEILRSGLGPQFWEDAKTALVPFVDPKVYGRSVLEGASFIVSSAYADPSRHGQAFQPRLSGITCEFLHMWIIAMGGTEPFRVGADGKLELALDPRLPGWLFTKEPSMRSYFDPVDGWKEVEIPANSLAFKLLGNTLVVYDNPTRKSTCGAGGAKPGFYQIEYRNGAVVEVIGPVVLSPHAEAVRNGEVKRIDVLLQ